MNEFYAGVADIFEIEVSAVSPALDLVAAGWDSLAIVSMIALVDDCFNITLDGQSLGGCNTLADVELLVLPSKADGQS